MKPNFRSLRFSLRTLMLLTAGVAVLCALPVRRAYTQKRGRDWVVSQNGHISFSYKYDPAKKQWMHDATLPYPNWLIDALGIDFFASVDTVVLDNKEVVDLSPITDLQNLRFPIKKPSVSLQMKEIFSQILLYLIVMLFQHIDLY